MARRRVQLRPKSERGIKDWPEKIPALEHFLGAFGHQHLVEAILGYDSQTKPLSAQEAASVDSIKGSFKSWWSGHDPSGVIGRRFVAALTTRIAEQIMVEGLTPPPNLRTIIVKGTYREFYAIIPLRHRSGIKPPMTGTTPPRARARGIAPADGVRASESQTIGVEQALEASTHHPIWIDLHAQSESAKDGVMRGYIDQKLHYLSPDAADHWKGVIDADQYHQYDECKSALRRFTTEKLWHDFLKSGTAGGVVLLGAGAPHKDFIIINSFIEHAAPTVRVQYSLVDYSYYMLEASTQAVDRMLQTNKLADRVELNALKRDFLSLEGSAGKFRRPGQRVAWFILGGTIGNVDERKLLRSVASVAEPGDLFTIAAETVASKNPRKAALAAKYRIPEVRNFLSPALRAVWHDLKMNGQLDDTLDKIKVQPVEGAENIYSAVEGSITVELFLPIQRRKMVLLTSTRYVEEKLLPFVGAFGFKHELTVASDANLNYKHFVFRYMGKQTGPDGRAVPKHSQQSS